MTRDAINFALFTHLTRCGVRTREHPTEPQSTKRIRKSVSLSKGFRKRVIGIFIEAELNHEIRELLSDHATQLDAHYFRPTEDQVLREFMKAEPYLTIDSSVRLAQENQKLTMDRNKLEFRLERLEQACKDFL